MVNNESSDPVHADLRKLEVRIEELVRACALLKEENRSLKVRQESLMSERAELIKKTELARSRVEAIISRLKSMESGS